MAKAKSDPSDTTPLATTATSATRREKMAKAKTGPSHAPLATTATSATRREKMAKAKTDPSDTTLRDNCDICDTARAADKKEALQLAGKILEGKFSSLRDDIHVHLGFYRKNLRQGRVFDSAVAIAEIMLSKGQRLPEWLAVFVVDVLKGTLKRPTKHGKDKFANMQRDYDIAWAVLEVSRHFSLPKRTNNDLSKKPRRLKLWRNKENSPSIRCITLTSDMVVK